MMRMIAISQGRRAVALLGVVGTLSAVPTGHCEAASTPDRPVAEAMVWAALDALGLADEVRALLASAPPCGSDSGMLSNMPPAEAGDDVPRSTSPGDTT